MTEERKIPWGAVAIGAVAVLSCAGMLAAGVAMMRPAKNVTPEDKLASRIQGIRGMPVTAPDCAPLLHGEQPVVVLVMGQSNAANHAQPAREPAPPMPVLHDGGCGLSSAPLPGGTGTGGSLWPSVNQALNGRWQGHPIVWSVIAVDSSTIDEWAMPQSPLRQYWQMQVDRIKGTHWPVVAVLWQQGEADARDRTAMADYRDGLAALRAGVVARGIDAPWWVARSTHCPPHDGGQVREAVRQLLVIPDSGFVEGPDTDQIPAAERDGCHFTAQGVNDAAALWVARLKPVASGAAGVPGVAASGVAAGK
ncbi:sialate O-acetylesterase [Roseateles amylovorans]|uniref:Sialate O-acetylesterase n=1 Tax=Roseateles amylovorans TaxID=2978473 RepID=A0ABY6B4H4_9BURK|nr:sialate O-acetylesterase [Roseateles amylovorans]UXH80159.1 sialate O-acetylesterase [Roseateles amylovorans]